MNDFESILQYLQSPECTADMVRAVEEAKAKYKPLDDWGKAHRGKPKNLYEAVIQRETFKTAYEKVYGPGSY